MAHNDLFALTANISETITGIVAFIGAIYYVCRKRQRQTKLIDYLTAARKEDTGTDRTGARSVLHLMGHLSMTEADLLGAAFGNDRVRTLIGSDEQGRADRLLFQLR